MLDVKIDSKKLTIALKRCPKVLGYEMQDGLKHIQVSFLKKFRVERLQGPPGIWAKGGPGQGRGLFNRFKKTCVRLRKSVLDMEAEVYTDSKVAKYHEEGATIRTGRRIPVPFSKELAGSVPGVGEMYKDHWLKPRFKKPSRLAKTFEMGEDKEFLAQRAGRGGKNIKIRYHFEKQVRLKPRLEFVKTFHRHRPRQIRILNDAVTKALKRI